MIYFMRDEETRCIKIGFTVGNGEARLRDLQTGCPGKLMLLLQVEGSKRDETAWHERFADARERGEWFRPVPELLLAITEAKVLQLEAQNAHLQARVDAETKRLSVVRGKLGSLSAMLQGEGVVLEPGVSVPLVRPATSDLKAENIWLRARLKSERNAHMSLMAVIDKIWRML